MAKYQQGVFRPINPHKYKGDPTKIVYRSSWELSVMRRLDKDPSFLRWSSEETIIPYRSPFDNSIHRYFVDFYVELKDKTGRIRKCIWEVKPFAQTKPPKPVKSKSRKYINEVHTWGINQAKWIAAEKWAKTKGLEFHIITEKDLNLG